MYCALLLTAHAVLASVPVTVNVDLTTAKGVAYPHYWSAGVGSGNKIIMLNTSYHQLNAIVLVCI